VLWLFSILFYIRPLTGGRKKRKKKRKESNPRREVTIPVPLFINLCLLHTAAGDAAEGKKKEEKGRQKRGVVQLSRLPSLKSSPDDHFGDAGEGGQKGGERKGQRLERPVISFQLSSCFKPAKIKGGGGGRVNGGKRGGDRW